MISMPNALARRATCMLMRPKPTIPKVLPRNSVPCSDFFSHFPACINSLARPIGRAIANIIAKVCSATAIAFAPGVFMTAMPCRVAASRSMLSTPTPARPITRSLRALASNSAVTSTAERTMSASADSSCPANLPSNCSGVTTVQRASRSKSSADGEIFSATTTFMMNYRAPTG